MEPEEPAQPQESAGSETIQAWLRGHWLVVVGGLFVLVFATILANLGGDEPEDLTPATLAEVTRTPPTQAPTEADSHQIPPIDGCTLISDDEVLATLGGSDNTGVFRFSGGEGCVWQLDGGSQAEGLSVELVPGNPSDFATGAMLNDATGVPVPDIGDVAVWFGGRGAGTLSAVRQTDIGYLFMRLAINRPDVDDRERLGLASSLITSAMDMVQFGPPPPVEADLCELVTDNEAEELLAPHRQGRAAARDPLFVIDNFAGLVDLTQPGEFSCTKLIFTEIYVKVESAPDSDFGLDADVDGVPGEPVAGVGDMAMWFENVPYSSPFASPHEIDVLSVASEDASFRIVLALPDLTPDEQFETASELARRALGRLPGGLGEVVTFEREPVDRSNASFVDNLLAKELAGEWTRGEGLVATLGLFVGEVEPTQVLRQPELLDNSGTGVIRLAREYLVDGTETEAKTEIARLLESLFPSRERLEAKAGIGLSTGALGVQAISLVLAQGEEECQPSWFGTESCSTTVVFPELDTYFGPGKYKMLFPEPNTAGWTDQHFFWAVEAVEASAWTYEGMGKMPQFDLVFTPQHTPVALADHFLGSCQVTLQTPMQQLEERYFKQRIAAEMAHCLLSETFPAQVGVGYEIVKWWEEGLALWLSTVVYPKADLELNFWPDWLAAIELETTLLDRIFTNWLFFEHTRQFIGWQGNLDLAGSMPKKGGGRAEQEDALAGYGGIEPLLHTFAQGLTDEDIPDSGGGLVPYDVRADTVPISGRTVLLEDPPRFGVVRLHLVVDPDKYACIEYEAKGKLRASWRTGEPGAPGDSWSDDLPESLQGEAVFVVTTIEEETQFTVSVTDIGDNPDCEDEEEPETGTEPPPENCNCDPSDYFLLWQDIPDILKEFFPWSG